jgi:hypothetical protein
VLQNIGPLGIEAFAKAGAQEWARYGYTTAQEGRSVPGIANVMRKVADEGAFKIDVARGHPYRTAPRAGEPGTFPWSAMGCSCWNAFDRGPRSHWPTST